MLFFRLVGEIACRLADRATARFGWRGFSALGSRKRGRGGGIEESMGSSLLFGGYLCVCFG